jgi:hypothetical protein
MITIRRALAGLLLAGILGFAAVPPASAGYGNHAERATKNIQTRVGLAKATLLVEVNLFDVVETRGGFPAPPP